MNLNDELMRGIPNFPDIKPAKELWQPPEPVPTEIQKLFPTEESIPVFLDLLMREGAEDSPEIRDRIRGFVNYTYWLCFFSKMRFDSKIKYSSFGYPKGVI